MLLWSVGEAWSEGDGEKEMRGERLEGKLKGKWVDRKG